MRLAKSITFLTLALAVSLIFPGTTLAGGRWEVLGTTNVTDRLDHDTLVVTRAQGTFKAVKLKVLGHGVEFRSMKIHFANGDVQNVELRDKIPAGGESRVIDVEGYDRGIRSIEFLYDAQALRGRRARVRVFGQN